MASINGLFSMAALITLFSSIVCSATNPTFSDVNEKAGADGKEIFDTEIGFEILIAGKSMFPDGDAYHRFMSLLGNLVADGTLSKFVQTGIGYEGGGSYCIQLARRPDMRTRMNRVHSLLTDINPPEDTTYKIKIVADCELARVVP